MKKIILICTLIVVVACSCNEKQPARSTLISDFTNFNQAPLKFNGQVKSLKMLTYWAKEADGNYIKGDIITRAERDSLGIASDNTIFFNEDGIVTRSEFARDEGKINYWETGIEDNRIVKATWYANGDPLYYWKDAYNEKGLNIENIRYRIGVDTLLNKIERTYYDNGNLKEIINYNSKGLEGNKTIVTWDDSGKVTERVTTSPTGETIRVMKIEYDETGMFSKWIYEFPTRDEVHTYVYKNIKRDTKGNPVYMVFSGDKLLGISEIIIEYY
jgi:antitoxin component YwqK of YwqJK toxin-antitoxin module